MVPGVFAQLARVDLPILGTGNDENESLGWRPEGIAGQTWHTSHTKKWGSEAARSEIEHELTNRAY